LNALSAAVQHKRKPLEVARAMGSGPLASVEQLLHKRLRFLTLLYGGVYAVQFAVDIIPSIIGQTAWPSGLALFGRLSVVIVFIACCLLAAIVWGMKSLSLQSLRIIEGVLFGAVFIRLAVASTVVFWGSRLLDDLLHELPSPQARTQLDRLALSMTYPWVISIMVYGILVPNTWRRCTLVVSMAALACAGLFIVASITHSLPVEVWLQTLLTDNLRPLLVGSAIAIFGSYRIETLRQEAVEARRLGPYQLKRCLGVGGMGEVYLAEHVLLKRPCAIKLISAEHANDPRNVSRFEREVQATATLTHPNTIQVFDYGVTSDGVFYYAMEYLPGMNLQQLVLQYGPLSVSRAVHLLIQMSSALQEAHRIGLIHRDVKPGNVLLCERGGKHDVVKLLDFGLVRNCLLTVSREVMTQEGTIAGTPENMSPEQAAGEHIIDGRSDLYSLGALAYFLLTGKPPFERATPMRIITAHIHDYAEPVSKLRPDIPSELEEIVTRCLKKDPALRYPDAGALEEALTQCKAAGKWTEAEAADWWRTHRPGD
jgi:eukaryotic-like serine/threonine-protein kinase